MKVAAKKNKPRPFVIPCTWSMYGYVKVKASSLNEALTKASQSKLPKGFYIDDSFEVDLHTLTSQSSSKATR